MPSDIRYYYKFIKIHFTGLSKNKNITLALTRSDILKAAASILEFIVLPIYLKYPKQVWVILANVYPYTRILENAMPITYVASSWKVLPWRKSNE